MKSEEFATALISPSSPIREGVREDLEEFATAVRGKRDKNTEGEVTIL